MVYDAKDVNEVLNFINILKDGRHVKTFDEGWPTFRQKYILGDSDNEDVLNAYVHLLMCESDLPTPVSDLINP